MSVVDMFDTRVQETQQVVADLGSSFTKLEDDLELRVDEIAKSVLDAPPVVPELSASFSSFRALTTVSARGLPGVPESPGV